MIVIIIVESSHFCGRMMFHETVLQMKEKISSQIVQAIMRGGTLIHESPDVLSKSHRIRYSFERSLKKNLKSTMTAHKEGRSTTRHTWNSSLFGCFWRPTTYLNEDITAHPGGVAGCDE
jgi:hypothetical protein